MSDQSYLDSENIIDKSVLVYVPKYLTSNVLVVDIREKVREFTAERMLTKDNVPVTIDAILRYKVVEDRAKDAILNVENFNEMIKQVSQTTLRNKNWLLIISGYLIKERRNQ